MLRHSISGAGMSPLQHMPGRSRRLRATYVQSDNLAANSKAIAQTDPPSYSKTNHGRPVVHIANHRPLRPIL